MSVELEQLNQTLAQIYSKNIEFLKESFTDTYDQIEQFIEDVKSGNRKERYQLDFKDGYFDILDLDTNHYFYGINSYEDGSKRAELCTFGKENSIDLLRRSYGNKLVNGKIYKDAAPVVEYINKTVDFENATYEEIYKHIYIGTALGIHITEIDKKLKSYTTMIIEEDIEIFRLSLYVTDYTIFEQNNRKLFLSIGKDQVKRNLVLTKFYDHHKYMNYLIKYYIIDKNGEKIKDEIVLFFGINSITSFPYSLVLENLSKTVTLMKDNQKFLSVELIKEKKILDNKPVLLISAGPSLDHYIEWIEKNQDKFLIVAVDIIVKKLEKYNIVPDLAVSIDFQQRHAGFFDTQNPDFLDNSAILLLSQQHKDTIEILKDKHIYFSQVLPVVHRLGYLGSSPNVGTYSFYMSVLLGAKELYLVGNDAAFDQETGNRYASDSSYITTDKVEDKKIDKTKVARDDILEVKGNFRDKVKTNSMLYMFKEHYETYIHRLHEMGLEFEAYNLSDGAYIEGLKPLTKEQLDKKIFNDLNFNIVEGFETITTTVELDSFEPDIKIINSIITKTKKYQKKDISNKEKFLESKLDLMIWIIEQTKKMNSTVYSSIFLEYTSLIDIYINYFLNVQQKGLHSKAALNKVNNLWAIGIIEMFKDIKKAIS